MICEMGVASGVPGNGITCNATDALAGLRTDAAGPAAVRTAATVSPVTVVHRGTEPHFVHLAPKAATLPKLSEVTAAGRAGRGATEPMLSPQ